jgi:hypothetical protein
MASNPGREILSDQIGIDLVSTRVSGLFTSLTCFPYTEGLSATTEARKCLSPSKYVVLSAV